MSSSKPVILVADDEQKICNILSDILSFKGYKVIKAFGGREALHIMEKEEIDLLLLDLMMPDMNGKEVLQSITVSHSDVPVLMISAHGTIKTAVEAIKMGAYDFIEKPLDADRILITVKNALEKRNLSMKTERLEQDIISRYRMIGKSKGIRRVFELIELYAPSNVSVLITGESGTGKELVAHALHNLSPRMGFPLVKINCAAIPDQLVESELFGYEKGAFSGAMKSKKGKIELAQNGSLFLDEIGDLNAGTQAKLLRLLEHQEFERLGGLTTLRIDFRLITATNKNLIKEVEAGRFREDLYYRLDVARIHLPPLRERKQDIPLLTGAFIDQYCAENNLDVHAIPRDCFETLQDYAWLGNVRELKNYIQKTLLLQQGTISDAMENSGSASNRPCDEKADQGPESLKEACREFEAEYIRSMLEKNNWNITNTSKELHIDRSNLYKKMKQLGIEQPTSK